MFYKANSRQVVIAGNTMNYIEFGTGKKALVILPGLGDGLSLVHGKMQAIILALTYKQFARGFKVYIFSRKIVLNEIVLQGVWQRKEITRG